MKFILFVVLIIAFFILLDKLLTKWLGKDKRKISETEGKVIDRWGRGVILLIALVFLVNIKDSSNYQMAMSLFWVFFLIFALGFQSFMQWKFLKGSKEYLKTLLFLFAALSGWALMRFIVYPWL